MFKNNEYIKLEQFPKSIQIDVRWACARDHKLCPEGLIWIEWIEYFRSINTNWLDESKDFLFPYIYSFI